VSLAVRRILAAVLLIIGALALACGLLSAILLPWLFDRDAARVQRLEPISYAAFEDGAPGREAMIEGRLSERNREGAEGFIAYTHYVAEVEPDGDRTWREVEQVRPPLLVELPGGLVQLRGDYSLSGTMERYEQAGQRIEGLRPGARVIALGELVEGQEGIELAAEFVAAGTRAEYLSGAREASVFFSVFGRTMLCGSALMLAVGLFFLVQLLRRRNSAP
jgi:hypothetical protein